MAFLYLSSVSSSALSVPRRCGRVVDVKIESSVVHGELYAFVKFAGEWEARNALALTGEQWSYIERCSLSAMHCIKVPAH